MSEEMICSLTGCSFEDAKRAFEQTGNVVDAVDMLLGEGRDKTIKTMVKKELTEVQKEIEKIRIITKQADDKSLIAFDRHVSSELGETQVHREEKVLQNNCSQQCQIPSLE